MEWIIQNLENWKSLDSDGNELVVVNNTEQPLRFIVTNHKQGKKIVLVIKKAQ